MIFRIVDIILDYLKKTVHNLFTITTNIQGDVSSGKWIGLEQGNKVISKNHYDETFLAYF